VLAFVIQNHSHRDRLLSAEKEIQQFNAAMPDKDGNYPVPVPGVYKPY